MARRRPSLRALRTAPSRVHVRTRGPRHLQAGLFQHQAPGATAPPVWWETLSGSLPEWAIYEAHLRLGRRPGIEFTYQSALEGGRLFLGGLILDFVEHDMPIAINVNGVYYHYLRGSEQLRRNAEARARLSQYGYQLVVIDEDDALRDPVYYLEEALRGVDHSRER